MLYPTIIESLATVQLEDARRRAEHTRLVRQVRAETRHTCGNRKIRRGPLLGLGMFRRAAPRPQPVTLRVVGSATRFPR